MLRVRVQEMLPEKDKDSPLEAGIQAVTWMLYFCLNRFHESSRYDCVQVLARHEGAKTLLDVMDKGLADEVYIVGVMVVCVVRVSWRVLVLVSIVVE